MTRCRADSFARHRRLPDAVRDHDRVLDAVTLGDLGTITTELVVDGGVVPVTVSASIATARLGIQDVSPQGDALVVTCRQPTSAANHTAFRGP